MQSVKPSPCARLFEVEALRDGRLTGDERKNFEGHLARCKACAGEARALEALGQALQHSSAPFPDQLHLRRERVRLLAAFDQTLVASHGQRRLARPALRLALALLLCSGLLLLWQMPWSPDTVAPSNVIVQAQPDARWSRHVQGERERISLGRGELWIRVAPNAGARALLVLLPDGQLEDIGTTFSVSVADGQTTKVAVEEGSVLLTLHGKAPVEIGAGETWQRAEPPLAQTNDVNVAKAPASPATSASESPPPPKSPPRATRSPIESDASGDFRAAMAALEAGRHHQAAHEFARFIARHPRDARAQDAAYMRVIALKRAGDVHATRAAALDYLQRYPAGFRRAEVEMLTK